MKTFYALFAFISLAFCWYWIFKSDWVRAGIDLGIFFGLLANYRISVSSTANDTEPE